VSIWLAIAALNGALAIAAGAFASHGLSTDAHALSLFELGARYQMYHALALGLTALADLKAVKDGDYLEAIRAKTQTLVESPPGTYRFQTRLTLGHAVAMVRLQLTLRWTEWKRSTPGLIATRIGFGPGHGVMCAHHERRAATTRDGRRASAITWGVPRSTTSQ